MLTIDPKAIATKDLHQFMVGAVAPRPIAWASTVDENGNPNLAPYSFFNAFSSNPPILVFSSNRRVEGNTTKDTLHNIEKTREVVINVVSHSLVRQMAVTSVEFPSTINEFEKAGLTMLPSDEVKPFRVKESPVHFECKVSDILPLGDKGGAGHLIICNVVKIHIDENVVDEQNRIDPLKIDLMGRLGRAYYLRTATEGLMTIAQSQTEMVIGFDALPKKVQQSKILTGNEIGMLAGLKEKPTEAEILAFQANDEDLQRIFQSNDMIADLHRYAQDFLQKGEIKTAAKILFIPV
jgi:flavin reductase (DIM6/NTAB) family NADH-FMN oxidoreductase RutF